MGSFVFLSMKSTPGGVFIADDGEPGAEGGNGFDRSASSAGLHQLLLIQSCVSWMNQGRFNLSPSPDCMVKRWPGEPGLLLVSRTVGEGGRLR
ncbi:hypothetical protein AD428_01540 [Achromobacter sp. DMS1]|nr:hypothetical protein AD428_01540 [Achromobacter sp. DMS1]